MLFNLEMDTGDRLAGYVVPDGFSTRPTLSVRSGGEEVLVLPANEFREALVTAGRHETGHCGFSIDVAMLPALPNLLDLELYDVESQLLIYRRRRAHFINKKLLRLETHLFPLWRLDDRFRASFQYFSNSIEQLGRETVTQLFLLSHIPSSYLSGRVLYKNYAYFAESNFETVILMHEPYEEMAERLLVLRNIKKVGLDKLGMRDALGLKSTIDFAADLPMQDDKVLGRALRRMPPEVAATLANPLVRQLTTATPDEMPGSSSVSFALDLLASFAIVGVRREPETFLHALADLLGTERESLPPVTIIPSVVSLAQMLRQSGAVDMLIEKDVELYGYVAAAFSKVA